MKAEFHLASVQSVRFLLLAALVSGWLRLVAVFRKTETFTVALAVMAIKWIFTSKHYKFYM